MAAYYVVQFKESFWHLLSMLASKLLRRSVKKSFWHLLSMLASKQWLSL